MLRHEYNYRESKHFSLVLFTALPTGHWIRSWKTYQRVWEQYWRPHNTWWGKIAHIDGASTCCLIMKSLKCATSGTHWLGGKMPDSNPTTLLKNRRLLSSSSSHQAHRVEQSWQDGAHTWTHLFTHLPSYILMTKMKIWKVQLEVFINIWPIAI